MDDSLIDRLASESGMAYLERFNIYQGGERQLAKFATLVAEECAKAIDAKNELQGWCFCGPTEPLDAGHGYDDSAQIIRAKFPPPT
jgi:hypothetical protein